MRIVAVGVDDPQDGQRRLSGPPRARAPRRRGRERRRRGMTSVFIGTVSWWDQRRIRGSRASRRASPRTLKASTTTKIDEARQHRDVRREEQEVAPVGRHRAEFRRGRLRAEPEEGEQRAEQDHLPEAQGHEDEDRREANSAGRTRVRMRRRRARAPGAAVDVFLLQHRPRPRRARPAPSSGTVAIESAMTTARSPGPRIAASARPNRIAGNESSTSISRISGPESRV